MINDLDLLDNGSDLTGRKVEYFGSAWEVLGKNDFGDWAVRRYEDRPSVGRVRIDGSISPKVLPDTHPHFVKLL